LQQKPREGRTDIQSAARAAEALRPIAGNFNPLFVRLSLKYSSQWVKWVIEIAAGGEYSFSPSFGGHSLALKDDGTVVAWGQNNYGQATVPKGLTGVVAIAAGNEHSLSLKSDGTVIGWGQNNFNQIGLPAGNGSITAIAAGGDHSLALKSDGTVVAWGENNVGQSSVPADLTGVVAIAAGPYRSLALKSNGKIIAWPDSPVSDKAIRDSLDNVMAISAGGSFLALIATTSPSFTLGSPERMANGFLLGTLFGESGRNYTIQTSTNLTSWVDLLTVTPGGGNVQFTDTNAPVFPWRFYRATTH
jgi:hypothetical protein